MKSIIENQSHLVDLTDGWRIWKSVSLRATGFPVHWLDYLHTSASVVAIQQLMAAESEVTRARGAAIDYCYLKIKAGVGDNRTTYRRAERKLRKGRVPEALPNDTGALALFDALQSTMHLADKAKDKVRRVLAEDTRVVSAHLASLAADPQFREAIIWQNRRAAANTIDVLSDKERSHTTSRARRRAEAFVVKHLQRYAAKNDTIGFFGPFAWADWDDEATSISVVPGPHLLKSRNVYFEHWGIVKFCETLSRDARLLPWLAPRLHPNCRVTPEGVWVHGTELYRLDSNVLLLLEECDGESCALEIAKRLLASSANPFAFQNQIFSGLHQLAQKGFVIWAVMVPVDERPEDRLRLVLQRVGDENARQDALNRLGELEAGRARIGAAAGDEKKLRTALDALDATFERLTSASSSRGEGQMYAGRTLVYEDCVRDINVKLGHELLATLRKPLSLVLRTTAWYFHRVIEGFENYLEERFETLSNGTDGVSLDVLVINDKGGMQFVNRLIDETLAEVDRRWRALAHVEPGKKSIELNTDDLLKAARSQFPIEENANAIDVYHSPDVMIAARDIEAIINGDYQFVLGEIHPGHNPIAIRTFRLHHPTRDRVIGWTDEDRDRPRIDHGLLDSPTAVRVWGESLSCKDFEVSLGKTPSWRSRDKVLRPWELVIRRGDNGLVAKTRDGRAEFHIRQTFTMFFGGPLVRGFNLFRRHGHTPRVTLDRLVVERESWRFKCSALDFAAHKRIEDRFVGVRRWLVEHPLPRHVFLIAPFEVKPIYVDFESLLSVDFACSIIRKGLARGENTAVTLSEMLPAPDDCWLVDAEGNRYTSELRMVAVTPRFDG